MSRGVVQHKKVGVEVRRAIITATISGWLPWLCTAVVIAQSAPAFEVASVKRNTSGDSRVSWSQGLGPNLWGETLPVRGTVSVRNATLRQIVGSAYGLDAALERFLLTGGSEKILSTRFDITAKPGIDAKPTQARDMLRTLLAERFNLRIHAERQERPVYALTVARKGKLGPQLRPSGHDCVAFLKTRREKSDAPGPRDASGRLLCLGNYEFNTPGAGATTIRNATPIDFLAGRIQAFLDRPVIDATGLTGSFEWVLAFSRIDSVDSLVPSIHTAIQEQLGLRLERRTSSVEMLVIDSVEMPTPD